MNYNINYELQPGRSLGRQYKVVEFLGNGWEGEVYKVEERSTRILRAAKLFYKHRYLKRKMPHVEYAKKLHKIQACPIVIQYHYQDSVRLKGESVDFLVSDFVDGEVLSEYLARQPDRRMLPFEALHLFYALVQGVEQIHFLGEYHGDIHLDNIMVKRRGLGFDVHLIDLLHLGPSNKMQIQQDVYDLIAVFYELIGGKKYYARMPQAIKQFVLGKKSNLIAKRFKVAGHLRLFLENVEWG